MRSLLARIFLSFWLIIVITIAAAAGLGYVYAERARATIESFEVSDAMLEASTALEENGRAGLARWLATLPDINESRIYIVDERGQDILERPLPPPLRMAMRRFGNHRFQKPWRRDSGNLRPARPFTQLIGPDQQVYTLFVMPPQGPAARWLTQRSGLTVIILALLISAGVSYLLARAISRPIRRFRDSAIAIAGGDLDTRVADQVGRRRDEIGLLAGDFDRMAEQLERAWQRQTELTQNVSHELRSPLARLRVALELARRKTGELGELDRIDLETERLDELIGQLLEFSRLDADPHEPRSTIDMAELIQSVVDDARYEYGDEAVIEFEPAGTVSVEGYPNALRSALENILRNALHHGDGARSVNVSLIANGANAEITIVDQGGGIADDELDSIFEPFYRASDRREKPGTGLGLAIARRAIELNRGSVKATNANGGLLVAIRLPLSGQD